MPSGFRGSSGGSSRSSSSSSHSSSSSSHSSGGSSRNGSYYVGGRRVRVHGGGGVIVTGHTSGSVAFLTIMIIFIVITLFFGQVFRAEKNSADALIQVYDEEYEYYQNMIDVAKEKGYIITATVTNAIKESSSDKYYITYEFTHNGITVDNGYSFSIYSLQQASQLVQVGEIDIAVAGLPINQLTDSVPMDYEDFNKENEGRYITAYKLLRNSNTSMIVTYSLSGIFFVLIIVVLVKTKKATATQTTETAPVSTEKKDEETFIKCPYCGASVSSKNSKCPYCRASIH